MKKILMINHGIIVRSYILFPTLLFAFSVIFHNDTISFVWPFVFIYSIEKVMPFILDGRLNLSEWSGVMKFSSLVAAISGVLATIGIAFRLEWLTSIGAIGIGFGVTALKLLIKPNQTASDINLKKINSIAGIFVIVGLIFLALLMMKVSLTAAFIFYDLLLLLEVAYAYLIVKRDPSPLNLTLSFNWQTSIPVIGVLIIALIISFFKKTGKISDLGWILVILAVLGTILETRGILGQPFKLFRIWLGAIRNYLIMYTVLFAFQQNQRVWIFAVFIELMLGGIVAKVISKHTHNVKSVVRYRDGLLFLVLGLLLTYFDPTYLLGTGIATICVSLLSQWADKQAPDNHNNADEKLSVFGSLCNQIILFGTLEIISILKLDNKSALLLPYISHEQALQDTSEMLYLRIAMIAVFIITGIVVVMFDHRNLEAIKNRLPQ